MTNGLFTRNTGRRIHYGLPRLSGCRPLGASTVRHCRRLILSTTSHLPQRRNVDLFGCRDTLIGAGLFRSREALKRLPRI